VARPEELTVKPGGNPDLCWKPVLDIGQEDYVLVRRRPPGGGNMYSQMCRVVQISHTIRGHINEWETKYRLAGTTL